MLQAWQAAEDSALKEQKLAELQQQVQDLQQAQQEAQLRTEGLAEQLEAQQAEQEEEKRLQEEATEGKSRVWHALAVLGEGRLYTQAECLTCTGTCSAEHGHMAVA